MEQRNVKCDKRKTNKMILQQFIFASLSRLVYFSWHHRRGKWKLKRDENSQRKKILGHLIQDFNKQLRRNQATNAQRARKSNRGKKAGLI